MWEKVMSRYFALLLLLCLFYLPVVAQDSYPMPTLPDTPIFVLEASKMRHHYVWLDNETLRFTPFTYDSMTIGLDPYEAYDYHVTSNRLERLNWSPFYLVPDENLRTLLEFSDDTTSYGRFRDLIPRSPYAPSAEDNALFLYSAHNVRECGVMCGYVISYSGMAVFSDVAFSASYVHPFTAPLLLVSKPFWAADGEFVVYVEGAEPEAGCCWDTFSFINLETNEVLQGFGSNSSANYNFINTPVSNAVYALSSEFAPRVLYGDWMEGLHSELVLWTGSRLGSEECHCMLLPENKTFALEMNEHFAGANFIEGDERHILAVAPDGLRLYEVDTGEFIVINPELNSNLVDLAIFSPDNQHVAVIVDTNLYVLPTGFTNL
jgi:hypothetical protein